MKTTQKQKVAEYESIAHERDLYQRYFWDQERQTGALRPDVSICHEHVKLDIYSLNTAHDGYCVVREFNEAVPAIHYWEGFVTRMARELSHHESTLPLRAAIERAQQLVRNFQTGRVA